MDLLNSEDRVDAAFDKWYAKNNGIVKRLMKVPPDWREPLLGLVTASFKTGYCNGRTDAQLETIEELGKILEDAK